MFAARINSLWWFRMSHDEFSAIREEVLTYLAENGFHGTAMIWDKNGAAILFSTQEDHDRFTTLTSPPASRFGL